MYITFTIDPYDTVNKPIVDIVDKFQIWPKSKTLGRNFYGTPIHEWTERIINEHPAYKDYLSRIVADTWYPGRKKTIIESWYTQAGEEPGLCEHYDDINGGWQITLLIYPRLDGQDVWSGGELLIDSEPDESHLTKWVKIPTAPIIESGVRWRAILMTGNHMHAPTASTGASRCCIAIHFGMPVL